MAKFENLLKPGKIGKLTVKNRMKYASTVTNFCDTKTGEVTPKELEYLRERAKGGFGIVTAGGAWPHILGKGYPGQMSCADDKMIPGLTKLAKAIKDEGAIALAQIMHTGRYAHPHDYVGHDANSVGPSAVASLIPRYQTPRELTVPEIKELVELHGQAARRFKTAGFDAIEICGIVGYLIANFLCKYTNKRTDEYGGSLENRLRFFSEIVDRVKKEVGSDMPVTIRINSKDYMPDGNPDEEYIEMAKRLEKQGVALMSLSVGWHESAEACITSEIPTGGWLVQAKKFKDAGIKTPIAMAYRLNKAEVAEKAVKDGIIDYWEMCRPGIADAYIPAKVKEGRPEDIAVCMACNLGCFNRVFFDVSMSCTINPRVGHEWDPAYQLKKVAVPKKVMIVGGGAAGMEAAKIAALRGHNVTLYEKGAMLGGQAGLIGKVPLQSDWADDVKYLETQVKKTGVKVVLNTEVTAGLIAKEKPEAVIIATGATPSIPNVPGITNKNVLSVLDVMAEKVQTGKRVVVVGAKEIGLQAAEWLAKQGKEITIIEDFKRVGRDVNAFNILTHRRQLKVMKMNLLLETTLEKVTDTGVVVKVQGKEQTVPCDTVVLATNMDSRKELAQACATEGVVEDVRSVGDCVIPRKAMNALAEGHKAGLEV